MNIVEQYILREQWEHDNTVGYLTMVHGDYFHVIRRAAQMLYKSQRGNFVEYLWHYHNIERQKYPAGRYRQFLYCATCRNCYGPAFKECPVCNANQLLKE